MNPSSHDTATAAAAAIAAYGVFLFLIFAVSFAIALVVNWRIASKAGYSGVLSLLMLIPFINFLILLLFAFTEWPIERELRARGGTPGGPYLPAAGYQPPAPIG